MIDFHKLDMPRPAAYGDKWVVMAARDMFLVLLKTGELAYGPDHKCEDYQFNTKVDAFFASTSYYNQNLGRTYPYIDEMLEELDARPLIFDEEDEESKTMEF